MPKYNLFQLFEKIPAFMKQKMHWKSLCESDTEENDNAPDEVKPHVLTYLNDFKNGFPELTLQQHKVIGNPFAVRIGEKTSHLSPTPKNLMEISRGTFLKITFAALSLPEFWI
jgi:hypothetical protein